MATDPDYLYQPIYGVEPYDALGVPESDQVGGGARVTQENLLVSLWSVTDTNGFLDIPIDGNLLKPASAFGDFLVEEVDFMAGWPNPGLLPAFNSRYSCRYGIDLKGKFGVDFPLLMILNPPAAVKQRMNRALQVAADGSTSTGWLATFLKSINDAFTPRVELQYWESDGEVGGQGDFFSWFGQMGYLAFGIGIAATNGADGNFPRVLPSILSAGDNSLPISDVQEIVDALNTGNWFLPIQFDSDQGNVLVTVEWPHSTGRG